MPLAAFERMNSGICPHGERRVIIRNRRKTLMHRAVDARLRRRAGVGPERKQLRSLRIRTAQKALRSIESGEAAGEIGLEILDVFQPDMKTQGWAARLPLRGGAIACAIEGNDQAFKAAP